MFALGEKTVNQKIRKHEIVCKHVVHEGRAASACTQANENQALHH